MNSRFGNWTSRFCLRPKIMFIHKRVYLFNACKQTNCKMADRSVSLELETNENQSVVKLKVKKWKQKYKTEYAKKLWCITKSNKSDKHAYSTVCSVDISVAHGGRQDITMPPYFSQLSVLISLISHKKTVLANKTIYSLIWYGFYDLRSGNGVGPILTAAEPTRGHLKWRSGNKSTKLSMFCTVCSVDILVAHGSRQDITTSPYYSLIISLLASVVFKYPPVQFFSSFLLNTGSTLKPLTLLSIHYITYSLHIYIYSCAFILLLVP